MSTTGTTSSFLAELQWRGLFHQATSDELDAYLATPRTAYAGFDPTADSLTIGNLVPIMMLSHWQRAGHRPVVLMGGGTGLIGDPSGKEAERTLRTPEEIEANIEGQRRIFEQFLDFDPARQNAAVIVNNADWLVGIRYIEFLRDIGKHFSVNMMIQKESVAARLNHREHGISYTEFSYMLLQAYDFLHLYDQMQCTVQMGGSDQFGNIVAGIDLIRRHHASETFGVTAPLVTRADGGKFGKTEAGSIWLTADRTSPYAYYQYWLNMPDDDTGRFLRVFTTMEQAEIDDLIERHAAAPHERIAQRALATHMTTATHGADELARSEAASQALFGGDVRGLDERTLGEVFADVPHSEHARTDLEGDGLSLAELLPQTTLADSKRQAREFLANGAVSVNGERVDAERCLQTSDLLHGRTILLRRGKKKWHAIRLG